MRSRRSWLVPAIVALVLAVVVAIGLRWSGEPDRSARPASSAGSPPTTATTPASPTPVASPTSGKSAPTSTVTDAGYATLTPYAVRPAPTAILPPGYRAVFAEHLGRHGSRTLTAGDHGELAVALWRRASRSGDLTALGARFGTAATTLDRAMAALGTGHLTARGEREQRGIGSREGERLSAMWGDARGSGDRVEVVTSGRTRAIDSAEAFVSGLEAAQPGLDVTAPRTDRELLYFDTTDRAYRTFLGSAGPWRAAYARSVATADLDRVSTELLRRLYSPELVASLPDPVAEAESVWQVYRAAPAMADDVDVDMSPFVEPDAAAAFAFVEDARYFYSRGPGVTGDDRSYRAARVLLDDFFAAADARLRGGRTVAVYRFAHAEELTPFAALLALPGSTPLPATDDVYRWDTSPFRTAQVTPLSGNVSWTVWRKTGAPVLVTVEHDEAPTTLGRDCRAETGTTGLYRLDELRRCLATA